MLADVLKHDSAPAEEGGTWEWVQDPDSGAMVQVWVDNPDTPDVEGNTLVGVKCLATAATYGSVRAAEKFGSEYLNEEWVKLAVSASTNITMRDKVTNIRTRKGEVIWSEEESDGSPTIFDVFRVSPVLDGFGQVIEKVALLKRAEVQ
jgi:hypothetical protein